MIPVKRYGGRPGAAIPVLEERMHASFPPFTKADDDSALEPSRIATPAELACLARFSKQSSEGAQDEQSAPDDSTVLIRN